jgi:hypothetical protein
MPGGHAGEALPEEVERALRPSRRKHKHVRVTTEPPAGSDPSPAPEPARGSGRDNDARLKAEKPPHY